MPDAAEIKTDFPKPYSMELLPQDLKKGRGLYKIYLKACFKYNLTF